MQPWQIQPDTGRRRDANAARVLRVAAERFGPYNRLHFYTLPLHISPETPLHSTLASRAARATVEQIFGSTPARWKLERSRGGVLHIHVVSPLPPLAVVAACHVTPVYELRGLLAYLAKPADARLTRPRRPWEGLGGTRRAAVFQALDERAAALAKRYEQGKSRLPPVQGWTGNSTKAVLWHLNRARAALILAFLVFFAASQPREAPPLPQAKPESPKPRRPVLRPREAPRTLWGL